MSNDKIDATGEKPKWFSPLRLFHWIDNQRSESTRRIIQGVITGLILTAILGTIGFIWSQRSWLAGGSKSIWILLNSPIQLQIWILLLAVVSIVWFLYVYRARKSDKLLLAQIEKLKTQISEQTAQDPKFIAIIKFIIDDNRAKGFKYLIEYGIGTIDKAVPLIIKSETFEKFLANCGLTLKIDNSVKVQLNPNLRGQMSFGVASMESPYKYDMAVFTIEKNNVVHMNSAAHLHFDWSYITFKKQFDIDFETHQERAIKQKEIIKAAISIHKKYLPIIHSWENCTCVMEDSALNKLRERQASFLNYVNQFWTEFEEKKLLIPADLAMDFQVIVNKAIEYTKRCDRALIYENSKPKNVDLMDSHYLPIDALQREIPILRTNLEKKIRSFVGLG